MKNSRIQDERIITLRRKIQSDAYQILVYCLLVSVLIQQFFLKAPFSQFAAELLCLIGMVIYVVVRHLIIGVDVWNSTGQSAKRTIVNSLTTGVISTGMLAVLAGERSIGTLAIFLVVFSLCYFFIYTVILYFNNKRQRQIDKMLEEADE